MSDFDTTPPPVTTGSQDERTMALLSHILAIFFSFIPPLIIWLVNKDATPAKPFVVDQAKEALNFQITVILAALVAGVLTVILIGFLLLPVISIANLVLCIIAGLKANNGEYYRYPFTLRLIK
jgi:uncharacterized protein